MPGESPFFKKRPTVGLNDARYEMFRLNVSRDTDNIESTNDPLGGRLLG